MFSSIVLFLFFFFFFILARLVKGESCEALPRFRWTGSQIRGNLHPSLLLAFRNIAAVMASFC